MSKPNTPITNTAKIHDTVRRRLLSKRLALYQGEISNLSFWISQCFMLLATVLGVYMAAQQGLQQAVVFEQLQSDKNNYYLRQSLRHELAENAQLLREHIDSLSGSSVHVARRRPLELETFVWQSMRYSRTTLETPPMLLQEARTFYRRAETIHQRIQADTYSINHGISLLSGLAEHVEQKVLPMFDADIEQLRSALEQQGLAL